MCSKIGSRKFSPGQAFGLTTGKGSTSSTWGFQNGMQYNARGERLNERYKRCTKGLLWIDSFWENGKEFVGADGKKLCFGVVLNNNCEFAILTMDAYPVVKPFHHRMPVVISPDKAEAFIRDQVEIAEIAIPEQAVIIRPAA